MEKTTPRRKWSLASIFLLFSMASFSQINDFKYSVHLEQISFQGVPALHSFAFAQHDDKWLIIGGRKDGLHARQPFNAFPQSDNNTDIYVIDVYNEQVWSASITGLNTSIREQLQSTNMNFYQDADTLYFLGGYAFSASQSDHLTFPHLTSIQVSALMDAVIQGTPINAYFKQITNQNFAITGGQMGKIGDDFIVVGGHRFDGRYNPMGNPTYTQSYTNQVRRFKINNSGSSIIISDYRTDTDPTHLRRRDYNLIPQLLPGGKFGYTISAGVFQPQADLPFLYPVDITDSTYIPHTNFEQYLSHYHGSKVALYDSSTSSNYSIFLGGMSQYYFNDATGQLTQDNNVPFVKTISLLTRDGNGTFHEHAFGTQMPALQGASSEFIHNKHLPMHESKLIWLHQIPDDTILLGHMVGGIFSPSLNPFSQNQTSTTSADPAIFAVYLINESDVSLTKIDSKPKFNLRVAPNPASSEIHFSVANEDVVEVKYTLTDISGKTLFSASKTIMPYEEVYVEIPAGTANQMVSLTVLIDSKHYSTQKVRVHKGRNKH
jgi:hypothetical protein